MASWPSATAFLTYPATTNGMPSPFAAGEPTYAPYDNFIRTATETGPGKVRRRFTSPNYKVTLQFELTSAQRTAFWNWYSNTIKEVLPFDWIDLRTNTAQVYRFNKRPSEQWLAGDTGTGWWKMVVELDTV